jgi:phosphatidylserine decarboxylase
MYVILTNSSICTTRERKSQILRVLALDQKRVNNKLLVAWEGIPFIAAGIILTIIFYVLGWKFFAIPMGVLTLFTVFFFRDPERPQIHDKMAILTPADGKILEVENLPNGDNHCEGRVIKVSIFMSLFNSHINRIPTQGKISDLSYQPGKFFSANRQKASLYNEHNIVTLETHNRKKIVFVQIAGLIARRISCWVKQGDYVEAGQRFGLIRFGSRLEVYLPADSIINVKRGVKVKAGQTIIGYLSEEEGSK